jgi:hypothetical protein
MDSPSTETTLLRSRELSFAAIWLTMRRMLDRRPCFGVIPAG